MRKKFFLTPIVVLILGILGALFRYWEVDTIFDPVTGLAKRYASVSILLIILTAVVILIAVLYARFLDNKGILNIDPKRPFPVNSKLSVTVLTILGVVIMLCSAYNYLIDINETIVFRAVFAVLGIGTGVAIITDASASYKGDESKMGFLFCIATLFMSWWLIMTYKENNSNPVLLEYCYECLGAIAATLSFYYATGHFYGKITPKRTVISHLMGIFFCLVTSLNAGNIAQKIIFAVLGLYLIIRICAYISGNANNEIIEE